MEKAAKLYYNGHADRDRNKPVVTFTVYTQLYSAQRGKFMSLNTDMRNWEKFWVFNLKEVTKGKTN